MQRTTSLITGAAGFIGSHLADRLLALGHRVIGMDNLRLGRLSNLQKASQDPNFIFIEANVNDFDANLGRLTKAAGSEQIDAVWHLAANSDIRAGVEDPGVDLQDTFLTTFNILRTTRALGIRRMLFASSSAIYGTHDELITEDSGPLFPISNYGAMKLASEAVISAALETHLDQAHIFRFPNVVGSRATHGVIFDFLRKLEANPTELEVLGDGNQEKPYLHVKELVSAMVFINTYAKDSLNCHNIGTDATVTTVRYIAEAVVRAAAPNARIRFTGESKGWPGDVPRFNYSIRRLCQLGWSPRLTSDQAVDLAVKELVGR